MVIVLKQRRAIPPYAETGVTFSFTGKRIIETVNRESYSEWRIRATGRKFEPSARWRRRITDVLRIEGRMPITDIKDLRRKLMLPFPALEPSEGYYWSIEGLEGVEPKELWVWAEKLVARAERIFDGIEGTYLPYYSFTLTFQWKGTLT